MGRKELMVYDAESGDLFPPRPRGKKRTQDFFMVTQSDAICLSKMKLTGMELSIIVFMMGKMNYENIAMVSQSYIAKELKATEATTSSCINKLIEKNLVSRVLIDGTKGFEITQMLATRGKVK